MIRRPGRGMSVPQGGAGDPASDVGVSCAITPLDTVSSGQFRVLNHGRDMALSIRRGNAADLRRCREMT